MASDSYHEPLDKLSPKSIELHRAIRSLMEELEAIDWYQQRVDASADPELQRILAHNRDEEVEHACMVLEWIRRHEPAFDSALRTYLFSQGDVTTVEERMKAGGAGVGGPGGTGGPPVPGNAAAPTVTIGSLRGTPR